MRADKPVGITTRIFLRDRRLPELVPRHKVFMETK
jgi:hypothetical protein